MDRHRPNTLASLSGKVEGTVSPAQPCQEGVAETQFLLGWGVERPAGQRAGSNRGRVARLFPAKRSTSPTLSTLGRSTKCVPWQAHFYL